MNGVVYCRVSSKEQIDGTSLQSQEAACREYAHANNIDILRTFVDEGESAKFADRTQLLELIDFCKDQRGKVQMLLVWKVDRFARNVADHFNVKATLLKYSVRIVSVTEPIDSNPEGKLMETILAGFAQFDNDIRAVRTVQGMRRKLQDGIFPWKPPLGYISPAKKGEKKTEPDRPVQPMFEMLQRAWKRLATGTYTKAEIRRLVSTWGLITKQGTPLSPQLTDKLFRNRYYAGILVDPWTGDEYEGRHTPMVSRADFARVQLALSRRRRPSSHRRDRDDLPLRGSIRCPSCESPLTASFSRGRSRYYPYYHCYNQDCPQRGKGLSAMLIHDAFADFLEDINPRPGRFDKLRQLIARVASERQAANDVTSRIQSELTKLKGELQEVVRLRARKLITDEEMLAQKKDLLKRRQILEASMERGGFITVKEVEQDISEITAPLSELSKTWEDIPTSNRRRFQQMLLPAGFVHKKVRTAERALLFDVLKDIEHYNTTVAAPSLAFWKRLINEISAFADILRSAKDQKQLAGRWIRRSKLKRSL